MDPSGTLLALFVTGTVVYYLTLFLRQYFLKWKVASLGVPVLRGPPFIGNLFHIVKFFNLAPEISPEVYIIENIKGYHKLFQSADLVMGSFSSVFYLSAVSPNTAEELLTSNKEINKSSDYEFFKDWLGTGLITSPANKWKKQRKQLTPAFHFRILDEFHSTMIARTNTLVHKLKDHVGKPFVDIEPYISNCALDIIAETAIGVGVDAQKDGKSPFVNSIQQITRLVFRRISSPWLWIRPVFYLSPTGREFRRHYSVLSEFVKKVIREKKARLSESGGLRGESESGRKAFLDMLLLHNEQNNDNQLSEQDIEDEVHTFAFAGHDTTTTAITWTLYMLGLYPDIQLKVQEEVDCFLTGDEDSATVDDLKNLQYLERVIKETMRLYPPVPLIARKLQEDFKCGSYLIPKSSTVFVALPSLHRHPKYFPNPEVFDPDRFLETNRHPYAYIPFSAGPRNCIGQRYAMLEMKTMLGILLKNFVVTSLDPRDIVLNSAEIISRPSRPIRLKLEMR